MTDTYKGESLQKKHARFVTHSFAQNWVQRRTGDASWRRGLHAFLASREGGDLGCLAALGVPWQNMVAFDRNEGALRQCYDKWKPICGESPNFVHCEDAAVEIGWLGNCLSAVRGGKAQTCVEGDACWVRKWAEDGGYPYLISVFLDFCCHIDKQVIDAITYSWRSMVFGSVLSVAVLKGREKQQSTKRASVALNMNRASRRAQRARHGDSVYLIGRMLRGEVPWDVPLCLETIQSETGGHSAAGCRWLFLNYALGLVCPYSDPTPLLTLEYQSRTKDSSGVPMLITSFGKQRLDAMAPSKKHTVARLDERGALDWRTRVLLEEENDRAALILNVSKPTASAWKAHATRGTYSGAA